MPDLSGSEPRRHAGEGLQGRPFAGEHRRDRDVETEEPRAARRVTKDLPLETRGEVGSDPHPFPDALREVPEREAQGNFAYFWLVFWRPWPVFGLFLA